MGTDLVQMRPCISQLLRRRTTEVSSFTNSASGEEQGATQLKASYLGLQPERVPVTVLFRLTRHALLCFALLR